MSRFWGNHVVFDRSDFEAMFSDEHGLHNYPSFSEELSPESVEKLEQIKEYLQQPHLVTTENLSYLAPRVEVLKSLVRMMKLDLAQFSTNLHSVRL